MSEKNEKTTRLFRSNDGIKMTLALGAYAVDVHKNGEYHLNRRATMSSINWLDAPFDYKERIQVVWPVDWDINEQPPVTIDYGLYVMLGGKGFGKTWFLNRGIVPMNPDMKCKLMRFGEPVSDYGVHYHSTSELEALMDIAEFLESDSDILVIDGLRPFVYGKTEGGTGEGGMAMPLFVQLTALSNVALAKKKLIIASLNPMTLDADKFDVFAYLQEASTPTIVGREVGSERRVTLALNGPSTPERPMFNGKVLDLSETPVPELAANGEVVSEDEGSVQVTEDAFATKAAHVVFTPNAVVRKTRSHLK